MEVMDPRRSFAFRKHERKETGGAFGRAKLEPKAGPMSMAQATVVLESERTLADPNRTQLGWAFSWA